MLRIVIRIMASCTKGRCEFARFLEALGESAAVAERHRYHWSSTAKPLGRVGAFDNLERQAGCPPTAAAVAASF
jgi:hypothetical protein